MKNRIKWLTLFYIYLILLAVIAFKFIGMGNKEMTKTIVIIGAIAFMFFFLINKIFDENNNSDTSDNL